VTRHNSWAVIAAVALALAIWGCARKEQQAEHEHEGEAHGAMVAMAADTMQVYVCRHHLEITQNRPGVCPTCGALLVLKGAPAGTKYVCPMHPEVSQDEPGRCPKCSMFLVAKTPEEHPAPAAMQPPRSGT